MEEKLDIVCVDILEDVDDAPGIERGGSSNDAMHLVPFLEQELGEIRAVLAGDAGINARFMLRKSS